MLKLAIAATISIASLLYITNITDARSIDRALTHYSLDLSKAYLIAEQSKSTTDDISQEDIQGIHKSLSRFFEEINRGLAPDPAWSSIEYKYKLRANTCYFMEAKSAQITSFSKTKTKVDVEVEEQQYFVEIVQQHPPVVSFKKDTGNSSVKKHIQKFSLEKINKKWQISKKY
jgi:hypothetical protein